MMNRNGSLLYSRPEDEHSANFIFSGSNTPYNFYLSGQRPIYQQNVIKSNKHESQKYYKGIYQW